MRHRRLRALSAAGLALVLGELPTTSTPAGAASAYPVTITVGTAAAGTVGAGFAGFSYEKDRIAAGVFETSNTALINMFKLLGPGYLRISGNLVNHTTWNASGPGGTVGQIAPGDVDKLAGFLKATGWKAIYGIDGRTSLSSSDIAKGVVTNTADNAASEAAYVSRRLGSHLAAFEIGNEPDQYSIDNTESDYETVYNSFTSAILKTVPTAVFDGPGVLYADDWPATFAADEKSSPLAFLSTHYYIGAPSSTVTTTSMMTDNPSGPSGDETKVAAAAKTSGIGWRMTEANSYYTGGKAGVSDTKAAALWSLDFMEGVALNGGSGVDFHGGVSSQFTLYYTPITFNSDGVTPSGVQGVYYGELLWKLAGTGSLYKATVTGDPSVTASPGVTAWGIGDNVVVDNKSGSAITATVTLRTSAASARSYLLAGSHLSGTDITVGGRSVDADGGFAGTPTNLGVSGTNTVAVSVPAHDAAVVQVTPSCPPGD
ncbi:hypothetical protein [Catenulispora pinisilvae]|uniref:hypothetical protein n=1 Tax=Catenulispora pinisilvae TaxID=2705253 RepID=UPI001891A6A8|nr:hypothetical protein [Catenulispora pinisilvae]